MKSYCVIHGEPESMNLGDIRKIDEKLLPRDVDLVTYGFPCQDISIGGRQEGLFKGDGTHTRSGLFFDALRVIEETKPRVAVAENVKNLIGKRFRKEFLYILEALENAGYNNFYAVANAKDYGVPQNRERVFIVSIRKDVDNGSFEFPMPFELKLRLRDMLEESVNEKYYTNGKSANYTTTEDTAKTICLNSKGGRGGIAGLQPSLKDRIYDINGIATACTTSVFFMPQYTDGLKIFKLTPLECWRLMGFDDADFYKAKKVNSNAQLFKQAGNSVVVPVLEHIFLALFKCGALEK